MHPKMWVYVTFLGHSQRTHLRLDYPDSRNVPVPATLEAATSPPVHWNEMVWTLVITDLVPQATTAHLESGGREGGREDALAHRASVWNNLHVET